MANRELGEVSFDLNGTSYTFVMDMEAMIACEDLFSTPDREVRFPEIHTLVLTGSLRHIRAFVWAGLQKHHPDLSISEVGRLLSLGNMQDFTEQVAEITKHTTPDPKDVESLGAKSRRPQKAQTKTGAKAGTGMVSTGSRAASV